MAGGIIDGHAGDAAGAARAPSGIEEAAMRIPKDIQIPFIVLSLEAVLLTGAALIFLMLRPG
jgi:hypothetical protein